jgi:hypothetical protein
MTRFVIYYWSDGQTTLTPYAPTTAYPVWLVGRWLP